jgi:Fe(II)/alpha-ketoglutarate-dependent arginine beta-hydroxylase
VRRLALRDDDRRALADLVAELSARHDTVEPDAFQRECGVLAQELPRRFRQEVSEFRLTEPSGVLLVSGLEVDDTTLPPTPAGWQDRPPGATCRYDMAFCLVAYLLGEPIAWATQQDGRIMHDVFPIRRHAAEQIGWSSDEELVWHTEDAFHPYRTDYLGLMCLRNPDDVQTTYADVLDVKLDGSARQVLSEPRFYILPDDSHRAANQVDGPDDPRRKALRERSNRHVESALTAPEPVAVLSGAPDAPYLRIDPSYMGDARHLMDPAALAALDHMCAAIDAAMTGVVLRPGDICFIDNYRAVHGRRSFRARFDGTDRWLRRLNIARDLRKSRELRMTAESRVIF